jgi:hypothetical protein
MVVAVTAVAHSAAAALLAVAAVDSVAAALLAVAADAGN